MSSKAASARRSRISDGQTRHVFRAAAAPIALLGRARTDATQSDSPQMAQKYVALAEAWLGSADLTQASCRP